MQNKNNKRKNTPKTQKTVTGTIAVILSTLTIPALSLIRIPVENDEPSFTIKFDMSAPSPTGEVLEVNSTQEIVPTDGITQEEYDSNNFYLVQNHKTKEVVTLTPTEYIKGVVSAEMPISFHDEALKAQAITAHSYTLRQIENSILSPDESLNGAYLSNDPAKFQACFFLEERMEFWGDNFEEYEAKLDSIVKEVVTQIAVVDNQPIIGAFHAISNGQTETAQAVWGQAVSYLVSTTSEGDKYSPNYEMTTTLSSEEVAYALKKAYPSINLDENSNNWFSQSNLNESGRVSSILAGDIEVSGHELRTVLNLRSASFEILLEGDKFTFIQTGYGHGVGLSQYGADYMAQQGYSYDEILKHYYDGVEIVSIV